MKAILEFNLDDFDEEMAHRRCVQANDMALCLWNIRNELFKDLERKYEMGVDKDFDVLDFLYEGFSDLLDRHGLILDKLTY